MSQGQIKRTFAKEWLVLLATLATVFIAGNIVYGISYAGYELNLRQVKNRYETILKAPDGDKYDFIRYQVRERLKANEFGVTPPTYDKYLSLTLYLCPVAWLLMLLIRLTVWALHTNRANQGLSGSYGG